MKMTNRIPVSWVELQEFVAYYFNYAGYEAITPYNIETVRGEVEVDVFVKASDELGKEILCECKFWNTPIPQEKIHAFRTVVGDYGASLGIIISKIGFQKGAYLAVKNSNVKLLTWEEFLKLLFNKWIEFRKKRLLKIAKPLAVYTDFMDVPTDGFTEKQKEIYKKSLNKYQPVYILSASVGLSTIDKNIVKYNEFYNIKCESYEEFFNDIETKAYEALEFYVKFFSDFDIPDWKFSYDMELINKIMAKDYNVSDQ